MNITYKKEQSGLTLIEVLIALLILSIGLLALAAVEVMGMRGNNSAYLRSQAIILANDLAERMHANPTGNYSGTAIDCNNAPRQCGNTSAQAMGNNTCTVAQMTTYDLNVWFCGRAGTGGISNLLPAPPDDQNGNPVPRAQVTCADNPCTAASPKDIVINWGELAPNRQPDNNGDLLANEAHGDFIGKTIRLVVVP